MTCKYFVEYSYYNTSGDYSYKDETFDVCDSLDEIAKLIIYNQKCSINKISKLVALSDDEAYHIGIELETLIEKEKNELSKRLKQGKERKRKQSEEIQKELYLTLKAKFEYVNGGEMGKRK